jgi:di/tricarboxylate transporter
MATAIVLALLVLAILNFALEWMEIEVFSLLLIAALVVTGVLSPHQAFLGFANSAVIMIAGVMLLTGGLLHHGAADRVARRIQALGGAREGRVGGLMLLAVNAVSSAINNVAATAVFIPVAEGVARRFGANRGKYLIPVAFASMTGGMCTLIGTSTNVAVSGALEQFGLAPLGFFELTPVGLAVAGVGLLYLTVVTPRLLRLPPEPEPVEAFGIRGFLFEIWVRQGAPLSGRALGEVDLGSTLGVNVLAIERRGERIVSPGAAEMLEAGDLLLVEGEAGAVSNVMATRGLEVKSLPPDVGGRLVRGRARLVEATVSYNSPFIGRSLKELDFRHRFELSVLAIHRRGEVLSEKVGKIPLQAGDVLLVYGVQERFEALAREPVMLLIEDGAAGPRPRRRGAILAVAIFAAAVAAPVLGWLDAPTAFLAGGALVLATCCLTAQEAARYVNIRFLVMLAGMSSLGLAMEVSGAAQFLADGIVTLTGTESPLVLLSVFFLLTVVLTQPLSNAAAALLVLPIALNAAAQAGVDPRSLAVATALGASCSFITPFEPACLLVYATGRYRFNDFVKVGTPLTLAAWLICLLLIPIFWPFQP